MCGICGILNFKAEAVDKQVLNNMCQELVHRGPDAEGYYVNNNIGLGHRRLSIIDLKTGNQPLHNETNNIWLIANGEIYNFKELRADLEKKGHRFYTQTDSEVILHLYEDYQEDCLRFLRGMFAFAIWDEPEKKLFLARDRLGQKPLIYWHDERRFIFASQIRAICQVPDLKRQVDVESLNLYLSFQYVPSPHTMFKGLKKLPAAHYIMIKDGKMTLRRYWHLNPKVKPRLKIKDYKQGILQHLDEAVGLRLVSDVPLGVFLSGGIDSAAVVSFMAKHLDKPVNTFSVGFSEKLYNELDFARIVAKKFATNHHELMVEPRAIEILPEIIKHYGEPFADYSCIPTYYIAQFAASRVKVVLNGDGGDESFAGYYRYTACWAADALDILPSFLRKFIQAMGLMIPRRGDMRNTNWQLRRFFRSLHYKQRRRYLNWIAAFNRQEKELLFGDDLRKDMNLDHDHEFLSSIYEQTQGVNFTEKTAQVEIQTYLPDDLLVKMDIATMANSLEARSPFLDHKFIEYVASVPFDLKLKNFQNKYILKQALAGSLPKQIIKRRKQGFGIPIGQWFRGQLKEYMMDVLFNAQTTKSGYLNKKYIENIIKEHMSGREDNGYKIWSLLMFELWFREFI